ncbi:MAG: hypothetical protein WC456_01480 [Patescibacteria group bacterium]
MEILYFVLAFVVYMIIFGFIVASEKIALESAALILSVLLAIILLGGSIIKSSQRLTDITGLVLPEPFGWTTLICGLILAICTFFGYIARNSDQRAAAQQQKCRQTNRLKLKTN